MLAWSLAWLACLLGLLIHKAHCGFLSPELWQVCEDYTWIAHLRSSLRSHGLCLICLVCVDGSLTRGALFANNEIDLYLLCVRCLVCLAWAHRAWLAGFRSSLGSHSLGRLHLARSLLSSLCSFEPFLVGLANRKSL